jgi:putative oxidoreductase
MFGRAGNDPRPIFPALGKYYATASDLAYLLLRVTVGLMVIPHGWVKVAGPGVAGVATYLDKLHIEPATPFAVIIMFTETIGGLLVAIGLFTRPMAALLVIEFIVLLVVVHVPRGYMAQGGIELPLLWLLMYVVVLLRGGGPWSLDRKIGKEI